MKIKFTERENRIINSILTVFRDSGSVPYLVGGYVRNKLIGITPKDFDIASSPYNRWREDRTYYIQKGKLSCRGIT